MTPRATYFTCLKKKLYVASNPILTPLTCSKLTKFFKQVRRDLYPCIMLQNQGVTVAGVQAAWAWRQRRTPSHQICL